MLNNNPTMRAIKDGETVMNFRLAKNEALLLPATIETAEAFFAPFNLRGSMFAGYYSRPQLAATDESGYAPRPSDLCGNVRLRRAFSRAFPYLALDWSHRLHRSKPQPSTSADKPFLQKLRELRLNPVAFKYDRAIGIEIETSCPCSQDEAAVRVPYYVRAGYDGSIRPKAGQHGVEFTMLLKRSQMEVRLDKALNAISAMGASVNKSCGLHVHFDMRGKSKADVLKIARKLSGWLKCLIELLPESRRENSYCALPFSATDRYRAVNVTAFEKYQTLEIRLHSATLDFTKILCWIRLIELLMAMKAAPRCEDTLSCLSSLPLGEHERCYWLNRHRQLNPASYAEATRAVGAGAAS